MGFCFSSTSIRIDLGCQYSIYLGSGACICHAGWQGSDCKDQQDIRNTLGTMLGSGAVGAAIGLLLVCIEYLSICYLSIHQFDIIICMMSVLMLINWDINQSRSIFQGVSVMGMVCMFRYDRRRNYEAITEQAKP